MISVNTHYLKLSIKHLEAELKRVKPKWDFYDTDNDDMAKTLIKSLLDEATTREIHARDPTDQMPAAVLWMHAMANRARINSDSRSPWMLPGLGLKDRPLQFKLVRNYALLFCGRPEAFA